MIVVIADDLSGAAELAGIAAARGIVSEVHTDCDSLRGGASDEPGLIAIDTDTRLLPATEAAAKVKEVAEAVAAARPEWIFKKTDSVLRGHVLPEIRAVMDAAGYEKCLLIPANPSKGRTISDGCYRIDGIPLCETVFRDDLDFPRTDMRIEALLPSHESVHIPDVCFPGDIPSAIPENTLPAGASDFFTALIGGEPIIVRPASTERILLLSGSLAAWDTGRADEMARRGFLVVTAEDTAPATLWDKSDRIMLAIGRPAITGEHRLLQGLIEKALPLIQSGDSLRLAVEGGATAKALIRAMGWNRFAVQPESHSGVGSLRPRNGPLLSIKPGSYPWPDSLFY